MVHILDHLDPDFVHYPIAKLRNLVEIPTGAVELSIAHC